MTTPMPLALELPALAVTEAAAAAATSTAMPTVAAKMFSDADVAEVRHVVQRILVPCIFVIGLLGNSVSIYVLTRKRMRCTTNIYLTALAITDIAYLTFVLILSLKHYEYIQYHCEFFWKLYGFFMWLCDACAYISIYIAMCFTIERFIAIRYPLKRQTFCTESLAKKVISAVALFCLLTTLSTAFEHTYDINWKLIDGAYRPCNLTLANVSPTPAHPTPATAWHADEHADIIATTPLPPHMALPATPPPTTTTTSTNYLDHFDLGSGGGSEAGAGAGTGSGSGTATGFGYGDSEHIPSRQRRSPPATSSTTSVAVGGVTAVGSEPLPGTTASLLQLSRVKRSEDNDDIDNHVNFTLNSSSGNYNYNDNNNNNNSAFTFNITEFCQNMTIYTNSPSSLGRNELYLNIWSVFTLLVFVLLPLFVLATFNCFLILLVHRSKSLRGDLTNASSIRRTKRKSNSGLTGSVSQENRVTITLIAVVLLFIICQLPWAIDLIVMQYVEIEDNIQKVMGNVCNLLVAINAAANFFLYCVLSDKYRKTVRELITGYRYRHRHARNNISLYVPHTTTTNLNGDGHSGGGGGGGLSGAYGSTYSGASNRRYRAKAAGRLIA